MRAALNLNVHVHALILDSVYVEEAAGGLAFHALAAPTEDEIARLLAMIAVRLRRLLERRGRGATEPDVEAEDVWSEEAAALGGVATASVQGRAALGPARVRGRGGSDLRPSCSPAGRRRACRVTRATTASTCTPACWCRQTIGPGSNASVAMRCSRRWRRTAFAVRTMGTSFSNLRHRCHLRLTRFGAHGADGTTHLRFDPIELLERLAALTPRPRINLLLYYGVLGAHAAWRQRVCPGTTARVDESPAAHRLGDGAKALHPGCRHRNMLWAELMRRRFPPSLGMCSMPSLGETSPEHIARRRVASTHWSARVAAGSGFWPSSRHPG